MALLRDTPIRQKLMTMILATSGVVLLLTCAAFVGYERLSYRRTAVRQLAALGEVIAAESTGAVAFENQRDAAEILAALKAERHIVAACIFDKSGNVFCRYPSDFARGALPATPGPDGYRFEAGYLVGFVPIVQVRESGRFGTLYLRSDMEEMHERLRLYGGIALLVVLLASIVAYALSRMLQRQISSPILSLAETARAISDRRDYAVRAEKHGDDELGVLTDAFNHMLAQIQEQNRTLERRVRERTAELESANADLEAFGSSVAHDLRTPLRAMTGFADVLLDPRAQLQAADVQRYVRLIRDGSAQMAQLISDLLAFSQLGRQPLSRRPVDLNQLCRDAYESLEAERRGRQVAFVLHPLPSTNGDPALLKIVFVNLLSNALKYSRSRDRSAIEVGAIEDREGGVPVYFVRDNGVGFDMSDAGKLFGVFQRLHHAHEFEGTGIGLATVRRIIERHGGFVRAEGVPDKGATFYFTVPVEESR